MNVEAVLERVAVTLHTALGQAEIVMLGSRTRTPIRADGGEELREMERFSYQNRDQNRARPLA